MPSIMLGTSGSVEEEPDSGSRLTRMSGSLRSHSAIRGIGIARMGAGVFVIGVLLATYAGRIAVGDGNPLDYFGYFTNQTSTFAAITVAVSGYLALRQRTEPAWLGASRGVLVSCLIVVAVIYNGLVPGTGTAPPWVSAVLHIVFPAFVVLDWFLIGDRPPLGWRALWIVLPYPLVWLLIVIARGATDGWVPYGFLLPERGLVSLLLHCAALLATLLAAGAVVWAGSRVPGVVRPAS